MALLAATMAYQHTDIEKFPSKPFNPLLGETYELIKPGKYKFLAEQVSHHPPINSYYMEGDSGWTRYTTVKLKSKFARGTLVFLNSMKEYIELVPHGDTYLMVPPATGIHNLIIGTPYLDFDTKGYIRNMKCPTEQYAEIDYHKRGWTQDSHYKVTGTVYSSPGVVAYKIDGKWNHSIYLTDMKTGVRDLVWTKKPYPEN